MTNLLLVSTLQLVPLVGITSSICFAGKVFFAYVWLVLNHYLQNNYCGIPKILDGCFKKINGDINISLFLFESFILLMAYSANFIYIPKSSEKLPQRLQTAMLSHMSDA